MQENHDDSELCLVVMATRRDGRQRYDAQSKRALARACLQPGVSLAGMALKHGVNANLLRKWVMSYQLANGAGATVNTGSRVDAFVPVVLSASAARINEAPPRSAPTGPSTVASPAHLRAQLPNGVTLEFDCAGSQVKLVSTVIEMLGRCDVSSRR